MTKKWKIVILLVFIIDTVLSNRQSKDPSPSVIVTMTRGPDDTHIVIVQKDNQQNNSEGIGFTIDLGSFFAFDYIFVDEKRRCKKGKHSHD